MNLANVYICKGIPAESIQIGMKLMVLERDGKKGPSIPKGSIGIVEGSKRCVDACCNPVARKLCKGYLISVHVNRGMVAHSCYFKLCTPEGIPVIFREEQVV